MKAIAGIECNGMEFNESNAPAEAEGPAKQKKFNFNLLSESKIKMKFIQQLAERGMTECK